MAVEQCLTMMPSKLVKDMGQCLANSRHKCSVNWANVLTIELVLETMTSQVGHLKTMFGTWQMSGNSKLTRHLVNGSEKEMRHGFRYRQYHEAPLENALYQLCITLINTFNSIANDIVISSK